MDRWKIWLRSRIRHWVQSYLATCRFWTWIRQRYLLKVRHQVRHQVTWRTELYFVWRVFLETEFDLEILRESVFANFKYLTLRKGGQNPSRDTPIYNPEGMAPEEYEEYWSYAEERMNRWLDYFNTEVFGFGVPLPYWNLAFLTTMKFHLRAVAIVVDLYYNNGYADILAENTDSTDKVNQKDAATFWRILNFFTSEEKRKNLVK